MKINCLLIGQTLCVAGFGGGCGSSHGGDVTVSAPAMIQFSDGSAVLGENKIYVSVDGVLRTLAAPDWQNNLAQHTAGDHSYIAHPDKSFAAIAGQFDDKPVVEVLGHLERIGQAPFLRMTVKLIYDTITFRAARTLGCRLIGHLLRHD